MRTTLVATLHNTYGAIGAFVPVHQGRRVFINSNTLYWKLSSFYFFYFASLGVILTAWGVYLHYLELSPKRIGLLFAAIMGTRMIAPYWGGVLADRWGKPVMVARLGSLLAFLSALALLYTKEYQGLFITTLFFSFFWNATLPAFESATLCHLHHHIQHYGRIRLWGSLGFIACSATLGLITERYGLQWVPMALIITFLGITLAATLAPEIPIEKDRPIATPLWPICRQPMVISLLIVFFLGQLAHGIYYGFFSLHLTTLGFSSSYIGILWATGVLAEITVFLLAPWLLQHLGARNMLLWSLILAALRWLLIAEGSQWPWLLFGIQMLHAATFGIHHAASIYLLYRIFPIALQGRAQALYNIIGFGAGGAVSGFFGGWVWETLGGNTVFWFAAFFSTLALWVTYKNIHENRVPSL